MQTEARPAAPSIENHINTTYGRFLISKANFQMVQLCFSASSVVHPKPHLKDRNRHSNIVCAVISVSFNMFWRFKNHITCDSLKKNSNDLFKGIKAWRMLCYCKCPPNPYTAITCCIKTRIHHHYCSIHNATQVAINYCTKIKVLLER